MSQGKVASIAVAISFCSALSAVAQEPVPTNAGSAVVTTTGYNASLNGGDGLVRFLQDEEDTSDTTATQEKEEGAESKSKSASDSPRSTAPLGTLPRSTKDESDATKVQQPTVASAPRFLDELKMPSLSLENIGTGDVPDDLAADQLPDPIPLPLAVDRGKTISYTKHWMPFGFCHQPLYFEDAMLERHGHERFPHLQPLISSARFFGSIPLAPYQWTLQHPLEDRNTLGSYRAGTPAPLIRQRLPYDQRALRNQIGASAAAAVAIP